jgi:glutamate synthase domain-containing protein 2
MAMREEMLESPLFGGRAGQAERLRGVIVPGGSDSASLDNAFELLLRAGRSPVTSMMMLVPQAWEKYPDIEPDIRAFYEYHQCVLEPWDGPAALAYTDGITAAVSLDRNGPAPVPLQGARGRDGGRRLRGGRGGLRPRRGGRDRGAWGRGRCSSWTPRCSASCSTSRPSARSPRAGPYAQWVARYMATLPSSAGEEPLIPPGGELRARQLAFGYGAEDLRVVLEPMGATGADAVWSMGDDTPIAPLSRLPQGVYAYLRQRFAQVTNPPIDSLRESMVMSLRMHLGRPRLAARGAARTTRACCAWSTRCSSRARWRRCARCTASPRPPWTPRGTRPRGPTGSSARSTACAASGARARGGATILVVSDRAQCAERAAVPVLLALGAVRPAPRAHRAPRARGARGGGGDAVDPHHVAALVGYGAEAVHPWLALESVAAMFAETPAPDRRNTPSLERPGPAEAQLRFRGAVEKGLLKILAKMGISTLSSYCGAQIFEALGLGGEVIDRCFAGTVSPIGGVGFREIAEDVLARHASAYGETPLPALPDEGRVRFRKDGEDHGWAPGIVVALQQAVGSGKAARAALRGDAAAAGGGGWGTFLARNASRAPAGPRDLLAVRAGAAVPLDAVEPAEEIRRRFVSSAMSLGALSPEAHATLAMGMNRMGARSNSGEGGEDPAHYRPLANGDRADNRIKQVASGRFGVTTEYLVRAEELEIKIVQGAKPGEGGQLPAHKVTDLIARLRHSVPACRSSRPPPHHDIYSIEDLAQLVHDLKTVNPRARVGVKLVAEAGVGTIAAGVAKAYADYVLVAGHNGGTGASPLSSIKHAGSPWELGARRGAARAGAQRHAPPRRGAHRRRASRRGATWWWPRCSARSRTASAPRRSSRWGARWRGSATSTAAPWAWPPSARSCAPSSPARPSRWWPTSPSWRRRCARSSPRWGARTVDEVVGRADLLERADRPETPRSAMLDLSLLLARAEGGGEPLRRTLARNDRPGFASLDDAILADGAAAAIERREPFAAAYPIRNHHLTVGGPRRGARRRRARRRGAAARVAPACASPGARGRASAPSPPPACGSTSRARRTTTWARG